MFMAAIKDEESFDYEVELVDVKKLHIHEEIIEDRAKNLVKEIKEDGALFHPVVVDKNSYVILDGHHRFESLKRLGCKKIPCIMVDYMGDGRIDVYRWYPIIKAKREDVIHLLEEHFDMEYVATQDELFKIVNKNRWMGIIPPELTKEKVVEHGSMDKPYPPKSSRHVMPRVKHADFPINDL